MNVIEIRDIHKSYGKLEALKGISLDVSEGEIFGLIGPDGAGKSTLFRILTTLMIPDGGTARLYGMDTVKDYKKIRKIVGYMPGKFSLYQDLSVEENLRFFATLFGTTVEENYSNIKEIYSQIEPFKDRKAGKLSGGMKQKLALSCALVHKPKLLFLDEPTTGVDAVSRKDFWNMLKRIAASGVTVFVSTPYMDEASMCDRIALIKEGQIIDCGTPEEIVDKYPHKLLSVQGEPMHKLLKYLRTRKDTLSCFSFGDSHHLVLKEDGASDRLAAEIMAEGFKNVHVTVIEPGIEDCFMDLAQK